MTRPNQIQRGYLAMWVLLAAAIALLVWSFTADARDYSNHVDNAIVLLADMSDSMKEDERIVVRESHAQALVSREVLEAIRQGPLQRIAVAYVEFGSRAQVVVDWTVVEGAESAETFSHAILSAERNETGPLTCITCALRTAVELYERLPHETFSRTVDVAGDGKNNTGTFQIPRAMLLDMGATINGLPMTLAPDSADIIDYYRDEIIGGPRAFSIELRDINDMPMLVRRKLVVELG